MSTGYGWEGIRQVCAMLLGARHVPERLCGGACLQRGAITSVRPLAFTFRSATSIIWKKDWLKSGVTLIRTLSTEQWISGVINCVNVSARKEDTLNIWCKPLDCFDWYWLHLRTLGVRQRYLKFDMPAKTRWNYSGSNSRWRPAAILENFKRPYLSDASSDRLRVWF